MAQRKMSTWTLGAIMVLVPTCFYAGTALNRPSPSEELRESRLAAVQDPTSSPSPDSTSADVNANAPAAATPTATVPAPKSPAYNEDSYIQSRLKSRIMLEKELKDHKEKLRRVEERMKKQQQPTSESVA